MRRVASLLPLVFVLVAACGVGCGAHVPPTQPPTPPVAPVAAAPRYHAKRVGCDMPANQFVAELGGEVAIACPAGCVAGPVWGTDIYTNDSAMCIAAVHAGVTTAADGGAVLVTLLPGQAAYVASARNGVTSVAWGSWDRSYRLRALAAGEVDVPAEPDDDTPVVDPTAQNGKSPSNLLSCDATAANLTGGPGTRLLFACPPGCMGKPVWGTAIYTDDSSICVAAVHAGVSTRVAGGAIAVTILAGLPFYQGSQWNGVITAPWGVWKRSYRVDRR